MFQCFLNPVVVFVLLVARSVKGFDCISSTGASANSLVSIMAQKDFMMNNGSTSLVEYSNIQAKIDSLNVTGGKASWYVCSEMFQDKTLEMRAICSNDSSAQECVYVTEYNNQLCASSSLCQVEPFVAFQVDCQGLDKDFDACAINFCTHEGIDSCFPITADSGVSWPGMIASAVAWLASTMMGVWTTV